MKNQKGLARNLSKGFTIIEIIVVIAIIAVLASIILVNIMSYQNKGKDAAIKGNLATLATRGTAYFEETGNYNDFCLSDRGGAPIKSAIENPKVGSTFTCYCDTPNCAAATKWCACSPEIVTSTTVFCVDSVGIKKEITSDCATECPASGAARASCQ